MKFFQKRAAASRSYHHHLTRLAKDIGRVEHDREQTEETQITRTPFTLFVLLTSDKGLCGSLNTRLFKTLLESREWNEIEESQRRVLTVGKKAGEAVRRAGLNSVGHLEKVPERLNSLEAWGVISQMLAPYDQGECHAVYVVAPRPVNAFTFTTDVRQYVPFQMDAGNVSGQAEGEVVIDYVEPDREAMVQTLKRRLLEARFTEAFFELKATEYSSRMVAMKKATDAADEKIKDLTKQYHKARQTSITQQLCELSAALEAMSSQTSYETRLF